VDGGIGNRFAPDKRESVCLVILPGQGMEREGTSQKCRPDLAQGLFEAQARTAATGGPDGEEE
jgi:hypothetical protein